MQSKLIGMAMSEASNLFDSSGGAASGNKQDVINSAGMTVMKLLVQSKFSGMIGGGNSGGLGGIMSLVRRHHRFRTHRIFTFPLRRTSSCDRRHDIFT